MRRATLAIIATLLLCAALAALTYAMSPLFRELALAHDAQLTGELLLIPPQTEGRAFIGSPLAPLTVIAYVDPDEASARQFVDEVYPVLRGYADNGTIRFYPRTVLSLRDVHERSDRFKRMQEFLCFPSEDTRAYEGAYFAFLEGKALNTDLAFFDENYQNCLHSDETETLWHDAIETERLGAQALTPQLLIGIDGYDHIVLTGIPSPQRLGREIRELEIRIGE